MYIVRNYGQKYVFHSLDIWKPLNVIFESFLWFFLFSKTLTIFKLLTNNLNRNKNLHVASSLIAYYFYKNIALLFQLSISSLKYVC